ncbi:uncharacterized protein [Triticum aestivum]|uniref:uncharacterized protein n=1 Tax=Triticum aestivum TaxID=4565 RepID=UPI001D0161A1|nr:uncharacterized protein LOC123159407 [Triticum aestivum]
MAVLGFWEEVGHRGLLDRELCRKLVHISAGLGELAAFLERDETEESSRKNNRNRSCRRCCHSAAAAAVAVNTTAAAAAIAVGFLFFSGKLLSPERKGLGLEGALMNGRGFEGIGGGQGITKSPKIPSPLRA